MNEVMLYEVKDGQIVLEQFFILVWDALYGEPGSD